MSMLSGVLMKIAIDCTFFGHNEAIDKKLSLSTSIFTADILDAFADMGLAGNFTLLVNYNHESFFKERFSQYKLCVLKSLPLSFAYKLTWGKFKGTKYLKKLGFFSRAVKKGSYDAVWFPFAGDYTYQETGLPSVLTIHDLWGFHSSQNNYKGYKEIVNGPLNAIVCISEFTKNDFIRIFDYKRQIYVIPNSIGFDASSKEPVAGIDKKYILDINAYIFKKNPIVLLKAFNLIKDKAELDLVFCGGYKEDALYAQMLDFIAKNGLSTRVHLLFRVSDNERNWLLANASLFVTPSVFEGFGRTPVEAAICKVPVISTKETSLMEATMGLCNYVENPHDENELASLILKKIQKPDSQKQLEKIAAMLSEKYDSKKVAGKYWHVFEAVGKSDHVF